MTARTTTLSPTPTPVPAFAPVRRPPLGGSGVGVGLEEADSAAAADDAVVGASVAVLASVMTAELVDVEDSAVEEDEDIAVSVRCVPKQNRG
jgi:hypothetical protein